MKLSHELSTRGTVIIYVINCVTMFVNMFVSNITSKRLLKLSHCRDRVTLRVIEYFAMS